MMKKRVIVTMMIRIMMVFYVREVITCIFAIYLGFFLVFLIDSSSNTEVLGIDSSSNTEVLGDNGRK